MTKTDADTAIDALHTEERESALTFPCTFPIKSKASNVAEVIEELKHTKTAERSGRAQDQESEDAFEKLRRDGYM